jgi:hypothetical protein
MMNNTKNKKLLVLDIDNTLLHTWMPSALPPFIAPDDPHRTEEQRKQFANRLLADYPGVSTWNDAIICPRPHLEEFIHSLIYESKVRFGIYSTAAPIYITEVLKRLPKDINIYSAFIWGKAECIKVVDKRCKDLRKVSKTYDVDLKNILMIDDLPVVLPEINRLPIKPFRVDIDHEIALQDDQLKLAASEVSSWMQGKR